MMSTSAPHAFLRISDLTLHYGCFMVLLCDPLGRSSLTDRLTMEIGRREAARTVVPTIMTACAWVLVIADLYA